ncbi:hypothetical protein TELCIR_01036 [Teladorsagia circumcincta]|uniref:Uncharacterized protein n=1 Tax=Teladorsagia circumcincta TaxID=45464 RepID=A0A2G9V305_TELCI|nr:hypothetical protein TELCIR_01036 [Teladorsagia circumcincta]
MNKYLLLKIVNNRQDCYNITMEQYKDQNIHARKARGLLMNGTKKKWWLHMVQMMNNMGGPLKVWTRLDIDRVVGIGLGTGFVNDRHDD